MTRLDVKRTLRRTLGTAAAEVSAWVHSVAGSPRAFVNAEGAGKMTGLGLRGLLDRLDLLLHWLERGREYGLGQLGYVPAIADSGFNPFFDQTAAAIR